MRTIRSALVCQHEVHTNSSCLAKAQKLRIGNRQSGCVTVCVSMFVGGCLACFVVCAFACESDFVCAFACLCVCVRSFVGLFAFVCVCV